MPCPICAELCRVILHLQSMRVREQELHLLIQEILRAQSPGAGGEPVHDSHLPRLTHRGDLGEDIRVPRPRLVDGPLGEE